MIGTYVSTPDNAITVSELNWYLKELFDSDPVVRRIFVRGEISNFKCQYASGHMYFSLKDKDALVRSVMFRSSAAKLGFLPENGMKVIVGGKVSVYGKEGQYQLYADTMIPDGIGSLYLAFEQLKRKLEAEGLFSESHKKALPEYPTGIGIITSPTGAAVRDILNILGRRYPVAEVFLYPSQVQGDGAHLGLIKGIRYFNETKQADVIIIGRGGGSLEDLWEFNNEMLAREIYSSEIPVISAVGHETDFTICDFVADRRAPTPSAAAEIAVPDMSELKKGLRNTRLRINTSVSARIMHSRAKIDNLAKSRAMRSFSDLTASKRMDVLNYGEKLDALVDLRMKDKRNSVALLVGKLSALDPLGVISRGYAYVSLSETGAEISDAGRLKVGDKIDIRLRDGVARATVDGTEISN